MKRRRVITLVIFMLSLAAAYVVLRPYLSLDVLVAQEERMRQFVTAFPVTAWLAALGLYFVASLIPGTYGKAVVCGWLFGFWAALVIVNLALAAAAIVSFLVIRYVFQSFVHRRMGRLVRHIDEALQREGAMYLLTIRLLRVPFTLVNYSAAAATVPFRTFWWTTHVGILPGNAVFVLAGSQIPSLRQLVQEGPWSLINIPLLAAVTLMAVLPVLIRFAVRRLRRPPPGTPADSRLQSARHADQR